MKIKDITVAEVAAGTNWRVIDPASVDWANLLLEELEIRPGTEFREDDMVVYSCVYVLDSGAVKPLLMIKRVGDLDYGGDYCELVDQRWRQLGLVPNPQAELGQEYVANPLDSDPSFESDDGEYRARHASDFERWAPFLERG